MSQKDKDTNTLNKLKYFFSFRNDRNASGKFNLISSSLVLHYFIFYKNHCEYLNQTVNNQHHNTTIAMWSLEKYSKNKISGTFMRLPVLSEIR